MINSKFGISSLKMIIILFMEFAMPIIIASNTSVFAQDKFYFSAGYIINKSGEKIDGMITLRTSVSNEIWKNQFVISFCPQKKIDKVLAKAKAREKRGKVGNYKFFSKDISTANLQGYGIGDKKFVTKRMELEFGSTFLALEVLSEEEKTYKYYDTDDNLSDHDKYHIYREKPNGELELIR